MPSQYPPSGNSPTPTATETPHSRRILRRSEVEVRTGFKRAHIYSLMKDKKFPQRVRLGVRAVGWYEEEIDQWLAERERA
ncbi:AlpA family transcriptional regulator [Xanthomonas oryzae pv. oryzicola]|uniref:AlpA family transcriptional regulator n=1 Tax=Xanthomonas oryzae TaxID=347 RepID=UPI000B41EE43|nr:AlpA family transcriptional regulator [Xanthomonas oryzae]OWB29463.1 dipicolinate synthase [Xanthomonas oryzae pv. oryzicola]QBG94615.1 AlpA family phage regulatory protein [Xanthomonas oryzae]